MSRKEKLVKRLLAQPKDFEFSELVTLLGLLGYTQDNAGKTSGSRIIFRHDDRSSVELHKPHPDNVLKSYQIRHIIMTLKEDDLL